MMRTVSVMASVLIMLMGGGWMLQSAVPGGLKTPLVLSDVDVDQGIPLARIVLPATAPIVTAEEAAAVAAWWRLQSPGQIAAAQSLIPPKVDPQFASEPTELYAYDCADGSQVVLFTNYDGLLGRCEFDATGALRFCERKPSGILPIIIPHENASRRRLSQEAVQELAVRLFRLRECTPGYWLDALPESAEAQWQRDGEGWTETTKTTSATGDSSTINTLKLDANGAVREASTMIWHRSTYRRCGVRAKNTTQAAALDQPGDSEPLPPAANN